VTSIVVVVVATDVVEVVAGAVVVVVEARVLVVAPRVVVVVVAPSVVVVVGPSVVVVVAPSVVAVVVVVVAPATVLVVVAPGVVVVVVLGHALPRGMHASVTVSTSVRAPTLADRTSARIVHFPGRFPFDRVRTSTPVNAPHTESVPMELTRRWRTGPQWPVAWNECFVKLAGVHPASGWLRQSCKLKVHRRSVAVWQSVPPSGRGPLPSWISTRHSSPGLAGTEVGPGWSSAEGPP